MTYLFLNAVAESMCVKFNVLIVTIAPQILSSFFSGREFHSGQVNLVTIIWFVSNNGGVCDLASLARFGARSEIELLHYFSNQNTSLELTTLKETIDTIQITV